ncbi:MAG: bifunctional metallophosphatase/5'-nucleotidase [Phycisphaerales bacterium]|nr:bifunctional metallophosphatase/5'-nucleotidase [Phycisphaerales bacterium]
MRSLTLLQINDTHGYLEPHPCLFWEGSGLTHRMGGGLARIASVLDQVRRTAVGAVVTLDSGDTIHGTYPAVHTRGEAIIEPLNLLGLDAWTGHWDFAWGIDRLSEIAGRLNYPFLACNCYDTATGKLAFPPTRLIEREGVRIGIVGIAATIVDKTMPKHFSQGLRFTLGNEELPGHIAHLRGEGRADVVVALSHLGFPQDVKLAGEVSGIDVVLSGHTHNRLHEPFMVGKTAIIQSGCHGDFVGRIDLEIDRADVRVVGHQLIPVDDTFTDHPAVFAAVEQTMVPHRQLLAEVVGHTATDLNRATFLESTMDNLLLGAISEAAGTGIAFSNGWRYGAPVPRGPIRLNDLWNIIPGNPPVSVVELTGQELRAMIEQNLEQSVAADPYRQMGGYLKRSVGLRLCIKLENPRGGRLQELFALGQPVQPDRLYHAAFVTEQGVPAKVGRNRRDLEMSAVDALRRYCQGHTPVAAELRGDTVVV